MSYRKTPMTSQDILGFTIEPSILEQLGLDTGDTVEAEIFINYHGNPSFIITRPLRVIGSSKGITLRKYVVDELGLKFSDTLQVNIRKPLPQVKK